jgi:hypothetical protein
MAGLLKVLKAPFYQLGSPGNFQGKRVIFLSSFMEGYSCSQKLMSFFVRGEVP